MKEEKSGITSPQLKQATRPKQQSQTASPKCLRQTLGANADEQKNFRSPLLYGPKNLRTNRTQKQPTKLDLLTIQFEQPQDRNKKQPNFKKLDEH